MWRWPWMRSLSTLKRLTGEPGAAYPAPDQRGRAPRSWRRRPTGCSAGGRKAGPRARVMATLPPEAASQPEFVDKLVAAGMDCARINCAHDDPEMWGQMVAHVREAAARLERPCRVLMDIAGPKCRILRVKAPPKTRLSRGDRVALVDELRERTKEPIAFSLNFPELVDQLAVGSEAVHRRRQGRGESRLQGRRPGGDRDLRRA